MQEDIWILIRKSDTNEFGSSSGCKTVCKSENKSADSGGEESRIIKTIDL